MKCIGIVPPDTPIAPILASNSKPSAPERHFSAFPLTSHLHAPAVRLVSRHSLLRITISFLRVPEVHDGFRWTVYLSRSMTVGDVIRAVCEQLGLVKSLPVAGGGVIDYAIEAFTPGPEADGMWTPSFFSSVHYHIYSIGRFSFNPAQSRHRSFQHA